MVYADISECLGRFRYFHLLCSVGNDHEVVPYKFHLFRISNYSIKLKKHHHLTYAICRNIFGVNFIRLEIILGTRYLLPVGYFHVIMMNVIPERGNLFFFSF